MHAASQLYGVGGIPAEIRFTIFAQTTRMVAANRPVEFLHVITDRPAVRR